MRARSAGLVFCFALLTACGNGSPDTPASASASASTSISAPPSIAASTSFDAPTAAPTAVSHTPSFPANAVFDYQIGGAYPPAPGVGIVSRDRGDSPVPGRYNICYVNAFQTQPAENGWWKTNHDGLLLRSGGRYVEDPGWPGELILDLSTASKRTAIATIVGTWLDGCVGKGFQAVEPDNLDSWTRSRGLLTKAHALEYAKLLTARAHARGLAIAQKNTPELGQAGKNAGFDFAIAEECAVYDECGDYMAVYGDRVIEIEYTDNPITHYQQACASHGRRISVILRDRDVVAAGKPGYRYESC